MPVNRLPSPAGSPPRCRCATAATVPSLHITESEEAGTRRQLITVTGEVDLASATALYLAVRAAPATGPGQVVVVDLAGVRFMDFTGVEVLSRLQAAAGVDGREIVLRNCSPAVTRVLQLGGCDLLFRHQVGSDDPDARGDGRSRPRHPRFPTTSSGWVIEMTPHPNDVSPK